MDQTNNHDNLKPVLTPAGVTAFALGTAIGWGSLVVTSSSYLSQSGIAGSIAGMVLGTAVMLIIARNYTYLMQMYPDCGGAYTYTKKVFGYDFAFLAAWFLTLTYMSVLWANATSIPLFVKYFIGPVLQFGKLYTVFGYDIYVGEILITFAGILLTAVLCGKSNRAAVAVMKVLAAVFTGAIVIVVSVVLARALGGGVSFAPAYVPDSGRLNQVIRIAVISPWAFIGFESISHASEEFDFKRTKVTRILLVSVIVIGLLYILVTLLSVTAYPDRYATWLDYIRDRGNLNGIEALPAFYAANHYMGGAGTGLLMAALLSLVITSLIGNTMAVSRLFVALGRDGVLPAKMGELSDRGTPANAVKLIAVMSVFIPFVGRTAIGWIVDVTCIGATLIYGLVSAAALKRARARNDGTERVTGAAGLIIMIFYGIYTLLPALIYTGSIERETFFLFIVWSILGFVYFRYLLSRDRARRFGESIIVWVSLLALVLFISLVWMRQSMIAANESMVSNIESYYEELDREGAEADMDYIREQMELVEKSDNRTIVMAVGMFAFALVIMFSNHSYLNKRAAENEKLANIDSMTGVKSKHAYLQKEKEMNASIEDGRSEGFAVAVCDVNGLKYINDTLGHQEGDRYICDAAKMICEIFDHSPVYRMGGDEFVLLLEGADYEDRAELMRTLHERSAANIADGRVVVAGGVSDYIAGDDLSFHDVFRRADQHMYDEKMLLKSMGAVTREDE